MSALASAPVVGFRGAVSGRNLNARAARTGPSGRTGTLLNHTSCTPFRYNCDLPSSLNLLGKKLCEICWHFFHKPVGIVWIHPSWTVWHCFIWNESFPFYFLPSTAARAFVRFQADWWHCFPQWNESFSLFHISYSYTTPACLPVCLPACLSARGEG